ncbi:DNA-binding MarR family transcriptional regulator [Nitrobacteraceae bacterium AZCC 2161]
MKSSGIGLAIWHRMSKLKRLVWDPTEREMKKTIFLSLKHYDALFILSQSEKGGIPVVRLEAEMSIPQYTTSRIVAHLEQKRLVRRTTPEADRRVQLIEITTFGRDVATKMWDEYRLMTEKRLGSELHDVDLSWLNSVLDQVDSVDSIDARS